jgi:hypothetical protein
MAIDPKAETIRDAINRDLRSVIAFHAVHKRAA